MGWWCAMTNDYKLGVLSLLVSFCTLSCIVMFSLVFRDRSAFEIINNIGVYGCGGIALCLLLVVRLAAAAAYGDACIDCDGSVNLSAKINSFNWHDQCTKGRVFFLCAGAFYIFLGIFCGASVASIGELLIK